MRYFAVLATAALGLSAVGCDQLTATVQSVTIVTQTPDLADADGMDPSLVAHLPLASLDSNATAAFTGLGDKKEVGFDNEPEPVTGARVELSWPGTIVSLCDNASESPGTYISTSTGSGACGDPDLAYEVDAIYETEINTNVDRYTTRVKAVAPIDPTRVAFTPALSSAADRSGANLKRHPLNAGLQVDWSSDPVASDNPAFVTILRVNYTGAGPTGALQASSWQAESNNPIFDSFPRRPVEMIDLILGSPDSSVDVPANVFSQVGLHVLLVTAASLETDTSSNLSLGSGAMAGISTAFVFWVD